MQGVTFSVDEGTIFSLIGANGAGKTTTIKIASGLLAPDAGEALILNRAPYRDHRVLSEVGTVLEGNRNLYWRLSPIENIEYFAGLKGSPIRDAVKRGRQLLERFQLTAKLNEPVQRLSRGMQQRLSVLCSIVHQPRLLFLDEPTLGLDAQSSEIILDVMRELVQRGTAIILTSHQLDLIESITDQVAIISGGKIVKEGPISEVLSNEAEGGFQIDFESAVPDSLAKQLRKLDRVTVCGKSIALTGDSDMLFEVLRQAKGLPLVSLKRNAGTLQRVFQKAALTIEKE